MAIMSFLVATNVVASRPPERRPTGTPHARAKNVKRITLKASSYEGSYEATYQLLLILYVWLKKGGAASDLNWVAMLSSLVMMAKTAAEDHLTFGRENMMADLGIFRKLILLAKFIPLFFFTGLFRTGAVASAFVLSPSFIFILIFMLCLSILMIVMICMKISVRLSSLTIADVVQGSVGEVLGIVLWVRLGREGSRNIQFFIGGCLLLGYTFLLGLQIMVYGIGGILAYFFPENSYDVTILIVNIVFLCSGWIGYMLFVCQLHQLKGTQNQYGPMYSNMKETNV